VNAASRQPSANVAPGELVTLTGIGLGPQLGVSVQPDAAGTVPTVLAGTRVFFDDTPAPVLFVSAQHVDAAVPFGLQPGTAVKISVQAAGQHSSPLPVGVVSAEPAIFSLFGEGLGQAAARNEDGGLNLPGNPVRLGSIVTLFATGAGMFDPPLADGHVPPVPPPLLRQPLQVLFDEIPSEILFAGAAPGLIGVTQINVRVPLELAGSPNSQHIKIRVIVESISSAPATTIAIH